MRNAARVRRRLATALGAALIAAGVLAGSPAPAQTPEPVLHVATGPDDPSAPLIYASRAGLFQKAGLNVDLQRLDGSAAIGAALANGSIDIAKISTVSGITAIAKGLPFTIIGNIASYSADNKSTALIVLASAPVHSAKDLAGATIATVTLKDQNWISTTAWLDQHGVDWHALKYIEMPASSSLAALEQNRVAAATVYDPIYTADVATGKVRVIGYPHDAIARHFPEGVLIAQSAWTASHPEVVARFLHVVADASAYVSTHEAAVVPMVAQFLGLDPDVFANAHHPQRGVVMNLADLQAVIDAAAKYGVIPTALPARSVLCSSAPVK